MITINKTLKIRLGFIATCFFGLIGCVGPTSPFGAFHLSSLGHENSIEMTPTDDSGDDFVRPRVALSPPRQVLHRPSTLDIEIVDPLGVKSGFQIKVTYQKKDVTRQFLKKSQIHLDPKDSRRLKVTFQGLRFRSDIDSDVTFFYQRGQGQKMYSFKYETPRCDLSSNASILALSDFQNKDHLLDLINEKANQTEISPAFLAGLIAQESGFNTKAVSSSKAIGLTQITEIGEAEILKKFPDWPRYNGLNDLNFISIKVLVSNGRVNSNNEWRLNPDMSITGGASYLRFLRDYWQRPEKQELMARISREPNEVMPKLIIASYNAGPFRVSNAISKHQQNWLSATREMRGVRRYVYRVMSYCDQYEGSDP